jgi:hypothetical protein
MKRIRTLGIITVALAAITRVAFAEGIDLECGEFSEQLVDRLETAGLLSQSKSDRQRALAITRDLCNGAEDSAQQQHDSDKQEAMDNWFFENRPDKAGNKRLKNLKR